MASFFDLTGQVAIVTGGARGLGAGIAHRLRLAGAKVAVWDKDPTPDPASAPEPVLHDDGLPLPALLTVACDITQPVAVENALAQVRAGLGEPTILVNNAGITGRAAPSWLLSPDEVRTVFEVNFLGPFLCTQAVIPQFLQQRYGRIVNIASIAGKEGNPTLAPYSASKAALINFTKAVAKELVGHGDLCVNAVSPAVIRTPLLDQLPQATIDYMVSRIPMGRTGAIAEVAALVHYLASPECSFCTGQCYDISGGRATY